MYRPISRYADMGFWLNQTDKNSARKYDALNCIIAYTDNWENNQVWWFLKEQLQERNMSKYRYDGVRIKAVPIGS